METLDEYADNVEQAVRSAVAHAVFVLGKGSTPIREMSARWLELLLEAAEPERLVELALAADGYEVTGPNPSDGLLYVRPAEVAA